MKMTVIPIVIAAVWTITKGLVQGLEDSEIRGQVDTNHPNYSIIKIGQYTKKNSGDRSGLAVTQTLTKTIS